VILPFADDEELVGIACGKLASHLGALGVSFEIVAVDEDSGDNSHAVLVLMRGRVPELRVVTAAGPGLGFSTGAGAARGRVLWLIDPAAAASSPLAPFGHAYRRIARGEVDLVVVDRRFALCYRSRCAAAIEAARGRGEVFQRRLVRAAATARLTCDVHSAVAGGATAERPRWTRLVEAISSARSAWAFRPR
jgi:hypothetical protein